MNKHNKHDFIKELCSLRLPTYIHGPTGCGKTFGFSVIAEELKLPLYKKIVGAMMTESSLLGYANAEGKYVEGIVYKPYTEGGILVFDEIDNGNANTNLVVNAVCDPEIHFPVLGMKKKHKDCVVVATANTTGNGATLAYIGRNKLDQAMLNRFIPVEMDYDYTLEKQLAGYYYGITFAEIHNRLPNPEELATLEKSIMDFWLIRKTINELEIHHILSQRNLIQQSIMLASKKFNGAELARSIVYRSLGKDQIEKVLKKVASVEIEEFKKKITTTHAEELIDKSVLDKVRKEIEDEKQKLVDGMINRVRNDLRRIELEISNLHRNAKLVEEKKKLEEKNKELKELKDKDDSYTKAITEYAKQNVKPPKPPYHSGGKPILPNWDESIMGITPPIDDEEGLGK